MQDVFFRVEIQNLDIDLLCEVVDTAKDRVKGNTPWVNAINKAYNFLLESEDIILMRDDANVALIPSGTQDKTTYFATNGECACMAGQNGKPCWHRAAMRLMKRYMESVVEQRNQKQQVTKQQAYDDMAELFGYSSHEEMQTA